jgi:hypothetical protein
VKKVKSWAAPSYARTNHSSPIVQSCGKTAAPERTEIKHAVRVGPQERVPRNFIARRGGCADHLAAVVHARRRAERPTESAEIDWRGLGTNAVCGEQREPEQQRRGESQHNSHGEVLLQPVGASVARLSC